MTIQEDVTLIRRKSSSLEKTNRGVHLSNFHDRDLQEIDFRLSTIFLIGLTIATFPFFIIGLIVQEYFIFWILLFVWGIFRSSLQNLDVPEYFEDFSTSVLLILTKLTFFTLWSHLLHGVSLTIAYIVTYVAVDYWLIILCWETPSYFYISCLVVYALSTIHQVLSLFSNGSYGSWSYVISLWLVVWPTVYILKRLRDETSDLNDLTRKETKVDSWVRKMSQMAGCAFLIIYTLTCIQFKSSCSVWPIWIAQWSGFLLIACIFVQTFRNSHSIKFWSLYFLIAIEISFFNLISCFFLDSLLHPLFIFLILSCAFILSGLSIHPWFESSKESSVHSESTTFSVIRSFILSLRQRISMKSFYKYEDDILKVKNVCDCGRFVILCFFILFISLLSQAGGFITIDYVQNAFGCIVRKDNYCSGDCSDKYDASCICVHNWNLNAVDDSLRLNETFYIGAHNSYHRKSWVASFVRPLDYELPALSSMLIAGLRELELDVHWEDTYFRVYHVHYIDYRTTCSCFEDCLQELSDWSVSNPDHTPVIINFDLKNFCHMSGAAQIFEELASIISEFFGNRLIYPNQVRKNEASLISALSKHGWPTIGESRGKFLFNLLIYSNDVPNEICRDIYYSLPEKHKIFFDRVKHDDVAYAWSSNYSAMFEPGKQPIYQLAETGLLARYRLLTEVEPLNLIKLRYQQTPFPIFTYEQIPTTYYVYKNQSIPFKLKNSRAF